MRAFVWTNPRTFEVQQLTDPTPTEDEVVIRVAYAGICGSDLSGYLGENSLRKPPLVMGHEFTGIVIDKPHGTRGGHPAGSPQIGDLVAVNPLVNCGSCRACRDGFPQYCPDKQIVGIHRPGAFADLVAVPADRCLVVTDAVAGSLVEPLACSIRAVRQAHIGLGSRVVVFGAGIIGLFAVQAAAWQGAHDIVLVDTNSDRLNLGRRFGATHTVNPRAGDVVEQVTDLLGGLANRVVDAVGLELTRRQGVHVVAPGSRVVWIGLHEDDSRVPGNAIVRAETEVVGSFCYTDADFATAHGSIERGDVSVDPEWLDVRPAESVQACFDEQIDGPARFPKLVLSLR